MIELYPCHFLTVLAWLKLSSNIYRNPNSQAKNSMNNFECNISVACTWIFMAQVFAGDRCRKQQTDRTMRMKIIKIRRRIWEIWEFISWAIVGLRISWVLFWFLSISVVILISWLFVRFRMNFVSFCFLYISVVTWLSWPDVGLRISWALLLLV